MRTLVTGITGFAGGHLAELLLEHENSCEILGTARSALWPAHLRHLQGKIRLLECDLCDGPALDAILQQVQPAQIYHLAGYAHAGRSLQEPEAAWAGNLTATLNLFRAVTRSGDKPRILYVGSGLVYGEPESGDRLSDESSPLCPSTPYACSKAAADLACYQQTRHPGLDIVRVRPFNHIGPRQSPDYATAHFAKQIAAIEITGSDPVLRTGNLASRRDLTDVRDVVRAYHLAMERGETGQVYNIGTGVAHTMQHVVDRLCEQARTEIKVHQESTLMRAREENVIRADAGKLRRELGWQPSYTLERSLYDILEFWRADPSRVAN
jgi:GDP-4-dehydro-6-deoxy-D-mannose reductase